MTRIWAIAINTFREAVRDRVLHGVLAFAGCILLFTLALGELSLEQNARVVFDIGMATVSLFSVILAVFLGSSLLYKEIERKTLYVILPKSIRRDEFLLGKYLGIALTALVFVALMGAFQCWVSCILSAAALWILVGLPCVALITFGLMLWKLRETSAALLPFSLFFFALALLGVSTTDSSWVPILAALLLILGEVLVLAAVALFFSSFSTPFLTGVLSLGIWVVGRSADEMAEMRSDLLGPAIESMLHGIALVVPNFNLFFPGRHALSGQAELISGVWSYVFQTLAYAGVYSAVLLVAAALVFRRRDFI